MSTVTLKESGMTFGPFSEDACYRIEGSSLVASLGEGVKVAEFVLYRDSPRGPALLIVEAKSSSPQPQNQPRYDDFIAEIHDKLLNSLSLYLGVRIGRHTPSPLPPQLNAVSLSRVGFRLVLVIQGYPDAWLPPLQESLRRAMATTQKVWALGPTSVIVMNDTIARERSLVS